MAKGNERDDKAGGLGVGGPQSGPIGGGDQHQQDGDEASAGGEGSQRHPGGSSRDSENLG